jgi:hypothetical protein
VGISEILRKKYVGFTLHVISYVQKDSQYLPLGFLGSGFKAVLWYDAPFRV